MITLNITSNRDIAFVGIHEVTLSSVLSPNPPNISVDSDTLEYKWYLNNEIIGNENILSYTFPLPGIYTIKSNVVWTELSEVTINSYIPFVNENGSMYRLEFNCNPIILSANDKIYFDTEDAIEGEWNISHVINQQNYLVDFPIPLTGSWTTTNYSSGETVRYNGTENNKRRISLLAEKDITIKALGTEYINISTLSSTNLIGTLNKFTLNFFVKSLSSIDVQLYPTNARSKPLSELKSALEAPHWYFTDNNYDIVDVLTLSGTPIYFTLTGLSSGEYADDTADPPIENFYGGISGSYNFYYYDEIPSNITVNATVLTNKFNNINEETKFTELNSYANSEIYNTLSYTVSGLSANRILITKDGYNPIDSIQWINQKIPFIGIMENYNANRSNNDILTRLYPNITSSLTSISLSNTVGISGGELTFELFDYNTKLGGFVRGYITPLSSISATKITVGSNYLGISGISNQFAVYDPDDYDYRKINEDYDLGAKLKEYALPERMQNFDKLWEIISRVYGDGDYKPYDSVGKTIYERISNFVKNNGDLDTKFLSSLLSDFELWNIDNNINLFDYPEGIRRLIEFLSVNKKDIWGYRNNLRRTFKYINDESSTQDNLGTLINTSTVIFTAGNYIVIHSIREDTYELQQLPVLYTSLTSSNSYINIPSGSILNTYNFSTYNTYNPHGLYKDSSNTIRSNYNFYTYNNTEGDIIDSLIDWDNSKTTLSESLSSNDIWLGDNGMVEKILNYQIKKGLDF